MKYQTDILLALPLHKFLYRRITKVVKYQIDIHILMKLLPNLRSCSMKKAMIIQVMILLSLMLMGGTGLQAANINITIPDTVFDSSSTNSWWNKAGEDQEVEPGMTTGQKWDLEAFLKNGANLAMVGGFNFKTGQSGDGHTWYSGDLFIDVNGDALFGVTAPAGPSGGDWFKSVQNAFGYEYAVKMNFDNNTYAIYKLTADSWLKSAYYRSNDQSNPYEYSPACGDPSATGTLVVSDPIYGDYEGLIGDKHYQVTFNDLFEKIASSEYYFHFTMGCGNDNLMGHVNTPIPGSVLLLGSGLLGLGMLGWRKRKDSSPSS